jgi:hypothetical protein
MEAVIGENSVSWGCAVREEWVAVLGAAGIDVAEVHDATAFGELAQTERLGFCGEGQGGPYAEAGAVGLAQITGIITQLRCEAGGRQVPGARLGLAQNSGGLIAVGPAACAVHIFEGPS